MHNFVQTITLTGRVIEVDTLGASFGLQVRSGDVFYCYVNSSETRYALVRNLGERGGLNVGNIVGETVDQRGQRLASFLTVGRLVSIEGNLYLNAGARRVDVRQVHLLYVNNQTGPIQQWTTQVQQYVNQLQQFVQQAQVGAQLAVQGVAQPAQRPQWYQSFQQSVEQQYQPGVQAIQQALQFAQQLPIEQQQLPFEQQLQWTQQIKQGFVRVQEFFAQFEQFVQQAQQWSQTLPAAAAARVGGVEQIQQGLQRLELNNSLTQQFVQPAIAQFQQGQQLFQQVFALFRQSLSAQRVQEVILQAVQQQQPIQQQQPQEQLPSFDPQQFPLVFEANNWWVNQIRQLADRWLDAQFGDSLDYDYAKYRSYMDLYFKSKGDLQETALISRLVYGFSASYLLTGNEKYLRAAQNGIKYQQDTFRVYKEDCCFWAHGKYASQYGTIFESINGDDNGTIALYEQIYAIAGMTLYYRITLDEQVLDDIRRTVLSFIRYFKDNSVNGGYFSHLSPENFRFDNPQLGINQSKKNWNSVGDHIPAYLINLLIVIEPLAEQRSDDLQLNNLLRQCRDMLYETSTLIVKYFPDQQSRFVYERFDAQWTPDQKYSWQQNRGIVGHNLKIAWNLTRVANYYESRQLYAKDVESMRKLAKELADDMVTANGVDNFRGGCFDAIERTPLNGQDVDFCWATTKDFWQQEQAILAYLILYGQTRDEKYLQLAQEMSAFWNIHFLDRENGGVFFRTNENGSPIVEGIYGDKGGHAISGYHAFELCFLAHVYTSAYVSGEQIALYLRPQQSTRQQVLSLLPDYLPLTNSQIQFTVNSVQINGRERQLTQQEQQGFYVVIRPEESGQSVVARLNVVLPQVPVQPQQQQIRAKVGVIIEKHYDETEVEVFRRVFANSGYQLEFISNLSEWKQTQSEFIGNDYQQPIRVRTDFNDVDFSKYAGFILVGGYAMDRLRYEVAPGKGEQNKSRAVEFIRRVLDNPNLKVGTICHSAWLLSAGKQLLANRELTCAHNVISDVLNAGGLVKYEENGTGTVDTHVHGNLISAKHPQVSEQFATRFIQELNSGLRNSLLGV